MNSRQEVSIERFYGQNSLRFLDTDTTMSLMGNTGEITILRFVQEKVGEYDVIEGERCIGEWRIKNKSQDPIITRVYLRKYDYSSRSFLNDTYLGSIAINETSIQKSFWGEKWGEDADGIYIQPACPTKIFAVEGQDGWVIVHKLGAWLVQTRGPKTGVLLVAHIPAGEVIIPAKTPYGEDISIWLTFFDYPKHCTALRGVPPSFISLSRANDILAIAAHTRHVGHYHRDQYSGSRKILVRDGEFHVPQDMLPVYNRLGMHVCISASCVLPDGNLLIGGVFGEICQVSLDAEGNVLKSNFIGYLQDILGEPAYVSCIKALPGSNNYLIGSMDGALCLVQSKNNKMVIIDQAALPHVHPHYTNTRSGYSFAIYDIIPVSSDLAMIFASFPDASPAYIYDGANNGPMKCRINNEPAASNANHQWLFYIKISENKISLHQADWFRHDVKDDYLSAISASLHLPDGKLLIGNRVGDLFLVWGDEGVLKHQKIILGEETSSSQEKNPSREYARHHYFISGMVLVECNSDHYQILVQKAYSEIGKRYSADNYAIIREDTPVSNYLISIKTD